MRMDKRYKPELAVSDDGARQISECWLNEDKTLLVGTNGHWLVTAPVSDTSEDTSGQVTCKAIKEARDNCKGKLDTMLDIAANNMLQVGKACLPREAHVTFPHEDQVIPKYRAGDEGTITIAFSAKYLLDIAKALGADKHGSVSITFPKDGDLPEIVVQPNERKAMLDPRAIAVLMPQTVQQFMDK